jgi:hypothetical protein
VVSGVLTNDRDSSAVCQAQVNSQGLTHMGATDPMWPAEMDDSIQSFWEKTFFSSIQWGMWYVHVKTGTTAAFLPSWERGNTEILWVDGREVLISLSWNQSHLEAPIILFVCLFVFLAVLGFELRVYTLSYSISPFL